MIKTIKNAYSFRKTAHLCPVDIDSEPSGLRCPSNLTRCRRRPPHIRRHCRSKKNVHCWLKLSALNSAQNQLSAQSDRELHWKKKKKRRRRCRQSARVSCVRRQTPGSVHCRLILQVKNAKCKSDELVKVTANNRKHSLKHEYPLTSSWCPSWQAHS